MLNSSTRTLEPWLAFFLVGSSVALAQLNVDTAELSLVRRTAPAPRALALGVAGIALASEGSTAAVNPAGLTAIRRFEISVALAGDNHERHTTFYESSSSDDTFELSISEAWFVLPVPVHRGGLAFALGLHQERPALGTSAYGGFDPAYDFPLRETERIRWRGGPSAFTFASAVDLSPQVTLGLAVDLWDGKEERDRRFEYGFAGDDNPAGPAEYVFEDSYHLEHSGFAFRAGLMLRAAPPLRFGLTVEGPSKVKRQGSFSTAEIQLSQAGAELSRVEERFDVDEALTLPWSVSAGAVWHLNRLLLITADGRWTDLPRLEYAVRDDTGELAKQWPTASADAPYRLGWEGGGGSELIIPNSTLRLRAGYRHMRPSYLNESALKGRHRFSGGFGWIADAAFAIDAAVAYEIYEGQQASGAYTNRSTRTRVALGLAYRF